MDTKSVKIRKRKTPQRKFKRSVVAGEIEFGELRKNLIKEAVFVSLEGRQSFPKTLEDKASLDNPWYFTHI